MQMSNSFSKKAFTLIEVLIVVVIIWLLASALMTKFSSIRYRANDLSRRSDLNQIAWALIAWQMDHNGELPEALSSWGFMDVDQISSQLKEAWLDWIPSDPRTTNKVSWLWQNGLLWGSWQYIYMKITKNHTYGWSFVLMAKTETPGASNRVYDPSINRSLIETWTDSSYIYPCKTIRKWLTWALNFGWDCFYSNPEQLRFIIIR